MKSLKNDGLSWIIARSKGQKRYIALLVLGNILFACTFLVFSLNSRGFIDGAIAANMESMKSYGIFLFAIIVFRFTLRFSNNWLTENLKANLLYQIQQDLLHQILKKDYAYITTYHSGELVNRIFSDAKIVVDGMLVILPKVANLMTRLMGALVILIQMDKRFTIVFLVIGIISFCGSRILRTKVKVLHKEVQKSEDKVHSRFQETLENMKLIKAAGLETKMESLTRERQQVYVRAQLKRRLYTVVANTGMALIFQMGYLYALVWGGVRIYYNMMSYGTLTAILQLVGQVQTPFNEMSGVLQKYYGMLASAERLAELYGNEHEEQVDDEREMIHTFNKICIEDVHFSYDSQAQVLENVSLEVNSGDTVAITGPSGSGKSTLFLLLLGIYKLQDGKMYFRKEDSCIAIGKNTRKDFSYVPQGNTLFSGSIRDNLTMFNEEATEEEIWNALDIVCMKEFVSELDQGLDSMLGERGIGISEGQAQRIAIARALLNHPNVLLLDESTSALDGETEKQILENLSEMKEVTCLIITHRLSILDVCNRHFHLENGHIFEQKQMKK